MYSYVMMEYIKSGSVFFKANIKGSYPSKTRALEALDRWQLLWFKLDHKTEDAIEFIKLQQQGLFGYEENEIIGAYMTRDSDGEPYAIAFVMRVHRF